MAEPKAPKALDWVSKRADCSVEQLFMTLETVVRSDAKTADSKADEYIEFTVHKHTVDTLVVQRKRNVTGFLETEIVQFQRTETGITVVHRTPQSETPMFTATPHVSLEGDCMFEVDDKPLEPWQVSKKALEKLFFQHGLKP